MCEYRTVLRERQASSGANGDSGFRGIFLPYHTRAVLCSPLKSTQKGQNQHNNNFRGFLTTTTSLGKQSLVEAPRGNSSPVPQFLTPIRGIFMEMVKFSITHVTYRLFDVILAKPPLFWMCYISTMNSPLVLISAMLHISHAASYHPGFY